MRCLIFLALWLALPLEAAPPHVHGTARLEIVVDGDRLAIHLEAPLDSLLGFEHAPRTAAERRAVTELRARLLAPGRLFVLAAAAGCTAAVPELVSPLFAEKAAAGHLDLDADYRWQCARPQALRAVSSRLFAEFVRLRELRVDFVGPGGQRSAHLSAEQPEFTW